MSNKRKINGNNKDTNIKAKIAIPKHSTITIFENEFHYIKVNL